MAEVGVDEMILDITSHTLQRRHQVERLFSSVQPVAAEADDQEAGMGSRKRSIDVGMTVCDVEIIQRLGDIQITVGVEALDEFFALMF